MFWLNARRFFRSGVISFWRNKLVSLATILVMAVALFVFGALMFSNVMLSSSLSALEEKVDISIYFDTAAVEAGVLAVRDAVQALPEVKATEYVSREENLDRFTKRHENNQFIQESLRELQANPLGAVVHVRAKDVRYYERIASFLESAPLEPIIEKVNFRQNQLVIERLSQILAVSRSVGLGATIVFALLAVLVTFNTIRLAIYADREEIRIMKLVGARHRFIKGPYVVSGALYGFLAALAVLIIFYPILASFSDNAQRFFGGVNIFEYYVSHMFQILLLLIVTGVVLGILSSSIAVRRYLKEV